MGAIFPDSIVACSRCGNDAKLPEGSSLEAAECKLCESLGDRALVPLLRNPTPEAIARFLAAPKGSALFEAGLSRRGVKR